MKNVILIVGASALLASCSSSSSSSQGNAPLDTQAVADYQAKVYSGNTVPAQYKVKAEKPAENVLNASDNAPKQVIYRDRHPSIMVMPSVGYYHGW